MIFLAHVAWRGSATILQDTAVSYFVYKGPLDTVSQIYCLACLLKLIQGDQVLVVLQPTSTPYYLHTYAPAEKTLNPTKVVSAPPQLQASRLLEALKFRSLEGLRQDPDSGGASLEAS